MNHILKLSAVELRESICTGDIAAVEAIEAYLHSIEDKDLQIKAFTQLFAEQALEKAKKIDEQKGRGKKLGPLAGLPVALKDNICTRIGRTTCASRILENYHSPYNSTVAQKLEDAQAVIIGKTNMDEFAMGSSTENSCLEPTCNPWNKGCVSGGSSGGSAAAVSASECVLALGSDTGGSIRQPAAFCGVVGLKPTYGRISRYGLVAFGSSLDQIGPLARNVSDAALITQVIAGYDSRDSTSINKPVKDYLKEIEPENTGKVSNLTIGLPKEFFTEALDEEIHNKVMEAARVLEKEGARLVEVSLPRNRIDVDGEGNISSYAVACYYIIATAEASSNLSRYDGVHYGYRTGKKNIDIIELYSKSRDEGFGKEVKRRIMLGTYVLSSGYYDAYYLKALKVRRLISEDFHRALQKCDVILSPVTPTTAFPIGEKSGSPLTMYLQDIYTLSLNLTGLPGLSLPCGLSKNGLPVGMQFIGPVLSESLLFRIGRLYEISSGVVNINPDKHGAV